MSLILPQSTLRLIEAVAVGHRHPGLQLDKLSVPGDQTVQKAALKEVCSIPGDSTVLDALARRRNGLLGTLAGASTFPCMTTGPLTLHLARGSALENAGICLHPLYGFAYLPGSGLKGMARAYAESIWLWAQADQTKAWRQIEDVFGWAPTPDRHDQIRNANHPAEARREREDDPESPEIRSSSGSIVFHDAWPATWPELVVDIVNNHHPKYYMPPDDNEDYPPGDWEDPKPVYFLAVKPGTTFDFALAKRRGGVPDDLLKLAEQWLLGALCHLGAGAKTAAGYGAFRSVSGNPPALPKPAREVFEETLDLVTPAFLAGAIQQAEDCDLRPATLRGHLRWWWRTMHAGFLDVYRLRALEAAIWGDTRAGGAVRIVIEKVAGSVPQPYDSLGKANFSDQQKRSGHGIPGEDPRKTTQGLRYASYGMDETGRRRFVLEPPCSWRLRLIARPTRFFVNRADVAEPKKSGPAELVSAADVLSQAKSALWLLCHFGGVGSKAGKGFGALAVQGWNDCDLDSVMRFASDLRTALRLGNTFSDSSAHSASLRQVDDPVEVVFKWPDVWSVLDQIGFAYQTFAKKWKHQREKMALGLPRRIGTPAHGNFRPAPPATIQGRHSSPVRIHLERTSDGWMVRVVAFPAAHLPDLEISRAFLEQFLKDFDNDLSRRAALQPLSAPTGNPSLARQSRPPSGPAPVRVKFLGPHDGLKNAFWVQEEGKKRGLLRYGTPPPQLPDENSWIEVYPTNSDRNSPQYSWQPPGMSPDQSRGRRPPRGGRR